MTAQRANQPLGRTSSLVLAFALSGCAVGPDFHSPAPPDVDRYTIDAMPASTAEAAAPNGEAQRFVQGRLVSWRWWSSFGSPELDAIVESALRANPDLQAAEAALRAAHETALAQQSALWPSITARYSPSRQSISSITASALSSNASLYTVHTAQLEVSYAVDVFGGNRRLVESAQAQADVQRYQLEAAYLTLTANVAVAAIQEASSRAQLLRTRELIDAASRQLDMVRKQQRAGTASAAEVAAQETVLAQAQVTLPPLERQLAQTRDQLTTLTGRLPAQSNGSTPIALESLHLPHELPLALPSRVVGLRPDILAAEAQLQSASAQIGVAAAARLPSITLAANVGSSAEEFGELFKAGNGLWTIAADIAQPIFNAGSLAHRQRAAEAAYEQAQAQYRSTVLTAFQNVADSLHAIDADARALAAAAAYEAAAARTFDVAQRQWRAGVVAYPIVLLAEVAHAQAVIALVQAQAARLTDTVALFQALGGGWWDRNRDQQ